MRNRGITALLLSGFVLAPLSTALAQGTHVAYVAPTTPKAEYVVFLDSGNQLSSAAAGTLQRAASAARSAKTVYLVGRADHVAVVKQELMRDGVREGAIVVRPESTPPIARVADGVSDPAIRRVEIAF